MQFTMTTILAAALATLASSAAVGKRATSRLTLETSSTGLDGLVYRELIYSASRSIIHPITYLDSSNFLVS